MQKLSLLILISLCSIFQIQAQMKSPVSWTVEVKALEGEEYVVHYKAEIEGDWNIYSQHMDDGGPVPTTFMYDDGQNHFQLMGKNEELGEAKKGHDALFDMEVIKYAHQVTFAQKIKWMDQTKPITGQVEFMVCNEESCLPPTLVPFTIQVK